MKEKRWLLRKDYEIEDVNRLAELLGVDRIIATLLVERGITTFEEAKRFFRPSLDQLHDPFLMKDMERAIERINEAIQHKERILIYGDYDVDGTSAVALVYSYFHSLTSNIDFYIPDRDTEGYGISFKGIDYAHDTGVKLIIALDCGIKAIEQVDYANQYGIDCIIGDHHLPGESLPAAVAVLDPKREDCPYPYKELSGCGIGFKIIEAHLKKITGVGLSDKAENLTEHQRQVQEALKLHLLKYLDLVVVSIASDIVPITGENRVLAAFGLKVINTHPRPGIEALLRYGHIAPRTATPSNSGNAMPQSNEPNAQQIGGYFEKELTISDLVFLVGPRINAAGRIHDARDSVSLLLLDDMEQAKEKAAAINNYNQERKELDSRATQDAQQRIEADAALRDSMSIVLYDEQWHKGVVGIVASRLVEAYYKPAIVFTRSAEDMLVGSARSIKEFDIHTALEQCSDLLEHFGGHKCAAGVSLKPENYEAFVKRFEQIVCATMSPQAMTPEIDIDAEVSFSEHITAKNLRILKQFAPFGPGNEVPIFRSNNLVDTGLPAPRIVGLNHLKFSAIQLDARSRSYPAIAFKQAEHYDKIRRGEPFDLCYQLEENYWNGKTEIQLNVKDIRFHEA